MTKGTTLNLTQDFGDSAVVFTSADSAATLKQLVGTTLEGGVIKALQITSDDSVARVVDILRTIGGVDYLLCSINVPANSGTNGTTAAVDALAAALQVGLPLDALGKRVLPVKSTTAIKVRNQAALTAGKTITVSAIAETF